MEEAKKFFGRISGGKKLGKDQWLILILAGVLLCVISLPVERVQKFLESKYLGGTARFVLMLALFVLSALLAPT